MTPLSSPTSADLATILQHPLLLQLSEPAIAALSAIAAREAAATPAEARLLRQVLRAIDLAEVEIGRRAA